MTVQAISGSDGTSFAGLGGVFGGGGGGLADVLPGSVDSNGFEDLADFGVVQPQREAMQAVAAQGNQLTYAQQLAYAQQSQMPAQYQQMQAPYMPAMSQVPMPAPAAQYHRPMGQASGGGTWIPWAITAAAVGATGVTLFLLWRQSRA